MNSKTRAKPLAAEERRTAIVHVVLPLLLERGAAVTTAEMAEVAGIAEGTIFRVFPDKGALLHAAMKTTLDQGPVEAALLDISPDLPLKDQLVAVATTLADHFDRVTALFGVLRSIPHAKKPDADAHQIATEAMTAIVSSLAKILERHRHVLSVSTHDAAVVLRGLVFTNSHRLLTGDERMSPAQLVDILINGILVRDSD